MYHYLFPQLTMGLALLLVVLKWIALRTGNERYNESARFWGKIFAMNFAVGVITGIPMEFQFGTNWAKFSAYAGGVIGQTLAMEGTFAFFLESSFLGLFLYGERKLGPRGHFLSSVAVFLGSWLSGYFIVATNAWMQHPVAFDRIGDGSVHVADFWGLLLNPWALWQYAHTMVAAVVTASFVLSAVGSFYLLEGKFDEHARIFLKVGITAAVISSLLVLIPTGDSQVRNVLDNQPATFAAMEGIFQSKEGQELVILGQPDMDKMKIDNPLHIPRLLSFLTHYSWEAQIDGIPAFPPDQRPTNIPLLYYSYHIMVGLGTIFIAIALVGGFFLWRGTIWKARWLLWILMVSFPFPYIANTAGWMTAEIGRQPWLVYGLYRTTEGISPTVSAGNGLFTLLGFLGMYFVIGVMFLFLVVRKINEGPARV